MRALKTAAAAVLVLQVKPADGLLGRQPGGADADFGSTFTLQATLVKIIGNVVLVPAFGTFGAAWSSLFTHVAYLGLVLWFCVKNWQISAVPP